MHWFIRKFCVCGSAVPTDEEVEAHELKQRAEKAALAARLSANRNSILVERTVSVNKNYSDSNLPAGYWENQYRAGSGYRSHTYPYSLDAATKQAGKPDAVSPASQTTMGGGASTENRHSFFLDAAAVQEQRKRLFERLRNPELEGHVEPAAEYDPNAYNEWANVANAAEERKKMYERLRRPQSAMMNSDAIPGGVRRARMFGLVLHLGWAECWVHLGGSVQCGRLLFIRSLGYQGKHHMREHQTAHTTGMLLGLAVGCFDTVAERILA